jgi:hypothetical protein
MGHGQHNIFWVKSTNNTVVKDNTRTLILLYQWNKLPFGQILDRLFLIDKIKRYRLLIIDQLTLGPSWIPIPEAPDSYTYPNVPSPDPNSDAYPYGSIRILVSWDGIH